MRHSINYLNPCRALKDLRRSKVLYWSTPLSVSYLPQRTNFLPFRSTNNRSPDNCTFSFPTDHNIKFKSLFNSFFLSWYLTFGILTNNFVPTVRGHIYKIWLEKYQETVVGVVLHLVTFQGILHFEIYFASIQNVKNLNNNVLKVLAGKKNIVLASASEGVAFWNFHCHKHKVICPRKRKRTSLKFDYHKATQWLATFAVLWGSRMCSIPFLIGHGVKSETFLFIFWI